MITFGKEDRPCDHHWDAGTTTGALRLSSIVDIGNGTVKVKVRGGDRGEWFSFFGRHRHQQRQQSWTSWHVLSRGIPLPPSSQSQNLQSSRIEAEQIDEHRWRRSMTDQGWTGSLDRGADARSALRGGHPVGGCHGIQRTSVVMIRDPDAMRAPPLLVHPSHPLALGVKGCVITAHDRPE